jgi:putative alpha-1,2-mannosidase
MKPFGWDFDAVVANARKVWNDLLGRVEVSGARPEDRKLFYTCLYRAYSGKSVIRTIATANTGTFAVRYSNSSRQRTRLYSSDAFWGTQWTLESVWTLVTPRVASSWVNFLPRDISAAAGCRRRR